MGIRVRINWESPKTRRVLACLRGAYGARRKLGTVAIGLLAGWMFLHVMFGPNGMVVYQRKRAEYRKLQQENQRFTEQVKALKSDPKAIEKAAREELRYARPGEVVYVVPSATREHPATKTAEK
jgi:cell division protein FtsB